MKKYSIYILILIITGVTSCKKGFLDIEDPNGPAKTTPDKMLANVLRQALELQATAGLPTSTITQQLATSRLTTPNVDNWIDLGSVNYEFQNNYFFVASNNEAMMQWATDEGSFAYVGIGEIIKALCYAYTTDLFGEVYYDEANKEIAQPKFNNQDYVYQQILGLIDDAEKQFDKPSFRPVGAEDIFYGGDLNKWKKFGFALKARLLNHLSKKPNYNPQEILSLIDKSFQDRSGEPIFIYPGPYPDAHPWSPDGNLPSSAKTWNKYFVNLLKGDGMNGIRDPRLEKIVNPGSDGIYRGVTNGITKDGLNPELVGQLWGKFYTSENSEYCLLTFDELKFIEAEAAFRTGDKMRAHTAYKSAITNNLQRLGVGAAEQNTYMQSAAVAQNPASLSLKDIMTGKYISLVFQPEIWVDMRRMDYSPQIYPGLAQPPGANPALNGAWVRRLPPFSTEIDYNKAQVEAIGGLAPDYTGKKVWWDSTN